jgi:hypothetical protein
MADPNDLGEEVVSIIEGKFGRNTAIQFIIAWIVSFIVLITTFSLFSNLVPAPVQRIFEYSIPISIVLSLISVSAGNFTREPRRFAVIFSGILALVITGISIITIAMPDLVLQEDFASIQTDVKRLQSTVERLQDFNLSPSELEKLTRILQEQGFVTSNELDQIFGDERLQQEVLTVLHENNYVTAQELESYTTHEEVVAIVQAESTRVAAQSASATATSIASTCYLEPLPEFANVGIRKSPEVRDDNLIRVLYKGDQIIAIGHNGRTVNVVRWWLVEFWNGENSVYGWLASSAVKEVTETSCSLLEQVPGS